MIFCYGVHILPIFNLLIINILDAEEYQIHVHNYSNF